MRNRREADYREALLRSKPRPLSGADEQWLSSLPVKELQKRGLLPGTRDRARLFEALLSFFGVADREAWVRICQTHLLVPVLRQLSATAPCLILRCS